MDVNLAKKAEEVATQATTLEDLNGVMRTLMKSALEKMLHSELEVHFGAPFRRRDQGACRVWFRRFAKHEE